MPDLYALTEVDRRKIVEALHRLGGRGGSEAQLPRRRRPLTGNNAALTEGTAYRLILPDFEGPVYFGEIEDNDLENLPLYKNATQAIIWDGSLVTVDEAASRIIAAQSAIVIKGQALSDAPSDLSAFDWLHDVPGVPGIAGDAPHADYFAVTNGGITLNDAQGLLPAVRAGNVVLFVGNAVFNQYANEWFAELRPIQVAKTARDLENDWWALAKTSIDPMPEDAEVFVRTGAENELRWATLGDLGLGEPGPQGPPGASNGVMVVGTPVSTVDHGDATFSLTVSSVVYGEEPNAVVVVKNDLNERLETTRKIRAWAESSGEQYTMAPVPATMLVVTPQAAVTTGTGTFSASVVTVVTGSEHAASVSVNNTFSQAFATTDKLVVERRRGTSSYDLVSGPTGTFIRLRGKAVGARTRASTTIVVDNLALVSGALPTGVAMPASVTAKIPTTATIDIPDNGDIVVVQDLTAGVTFNTQWNTADAENFLWNLRGLFGYDESKNQSLYKDLDEDPSWKEDETC